MKLGLHLIYEELNRFVFLADERRKIWASIPVKVMDWNMNRPGAPIEDGLLEPKFSALFGLVFEQQDAPGPMLAEFRHDQLVVPAKSAGRASDTRPRPCAITVSENESVSRSQRSETTFPRS
jgi:hypothetical protein